VRFSWVVLCLGFLGPGLVLAAEWMTEGRPGAIAVRHREIRWFAVLPTVCWLALVAAAALLDLPA